MNYVSILYFTFLQQYIVDLVSAVLQANKILEANNEGIF